MLHTDTYLSVGGDCTTQHIGFSASREEVMTESPVLRVLSDGEPLVFALIGEADLDYAPALRMRLKAAVCEQGRQAVVVDLSACTYMDSATLNMLHGVSHLAQERQCQFILTRPSSNLKRIFSLVKMDTFLTVVDSLDLKNPC